MKKFEWSPSERQVKIDWRNIEDSFIMIRDVRNSCKTRRGCNADGITLPFGTVNREPVNVHSGMHAAGNDLQEVVFTLGAEVYQMEEEEGQMEEVAA